MCCVGLYAYGIHILYLVSHRLDIHICFYFFLFHELKAQTSNVFISVGIQEIKILICITNLNLINTPIVFFQSRLSTKKKSVYTNMNLNT